MATFDIESREVALSSAERNQVADRIRDYARAWAERQFASLPSITEPCRSDQRSVIKDVELQARAHQIQSKGSEHRGRKLPGHTIVGPTNGFVLETPPFDDADVTWFTQGDVICAPYAGRSPTGELLVRLFTGQGQQIDAWANAAIWFWAVPSAQGIIQFYPGPNWEFVRYLRGLTLSGANALGAVGVFTGVSVVTLNPFVAAPMSDVAEIINWVGSDFSIGPNSSFAFQDDFSNPASFPSGFDHVATLPHLYACCIWITASVSTRGNVGAWIDASLTIPSLEVTVP